MVSTVGLMESMLEEAGFEAIGYRRHYETMAFHSMPSDTRYHDADVAKQVEFGSKWAIEHVDADDEANDMHEAVVDEITAGLAAGKDYAPDPAEAA